ncbi:hypothetical protein BpHYR1_022994 [Brachionus plicatilis]|uniref:Uncharacterized protein n=1 Tax=Brachionus plicatilis TaxID=10195 RepID=A0A3M7QWX5_BRAPC|nr:hypothetical protein BpHYR1_022994 [Brachionus plicatilis]
MKREREKERKRKSGGREQTISSILANLNLDYSRFTWPLDRLGNKGHVCVYVCDTKFGTSGSRCCFLTQ